MAVEKVPKLIVPGLSNEQNEYIHQQHRELLKYSKNNNDNKEVAFVFREGLSERTEYLGNDESIHFGATLHGKGSNIFIMHNHPRNGSFSDTDIAFFIHNDEIAFVSVVKNNGGVEILMKIDDFDSVQAKNEFGRQYKKYVKKGIDSEIDTAIIKFLEKGKGGFIWITNQ